MSLHDTLCVSHSIKSIIVVNYSQVFKIAHSTCDWLQLAEKTFDGAIGSTFRQF